VEGVQASAAGQIKHSINPVEGVQASAAGHSKHAINPVEGVQASAAGQIKHSINPVEGGFSRLFRSLFFCIIPRQTNQKPMCRRPLSCGIR